nr:hypothetical protein GCM10020063_037380 [Dactylosporangium thailandense]
MSRPRVLVCGTDFGRIYLAALAAPDAGFELAGILARGGARSVACAAHYGVPLYTTVAQVPSDVEIACVVVGGAVTGGPGAELASALLARGIHVLQEHPLHHDELAGCLRTAHRHGVVHHLNTHYVHVAPVRRFVAAARALLARQRPLFVDAMVAVQVTYTLWDILGRALGSVRPWSFAGPQPAGPEAAFRSLDGTLAGVPLTLRVQQEMDPSQPDNFAHLFHRITIGTEGGHLTLVNTHGPVLWSPRPHMPADAASVVAFEDSAAGHLDFASTAPLGPAEAPSYREVLARLWPDAVRHALRELAADLPDPAAARRRGQYHLALCRLTADVNARLGPPAMRRHPASPQVLPAAALAVAEDTA